MYSKDLMLEKKQSTDFEFIFHDTAPDTNVVNLPRKRELRKYKISIMGMGYVGAVSSACFCRLGHQVVGIDPDQSKVITLNRGESPIVEEGLGDLLADARKAKRFFATTYAQQAIQETDLTLVSVGTPSNAEGACDLTYLKQAARDMGEAIRSKTDYHVFVFRSTVPPRTTRDVMIPILEAASGKRCGTDFGVAFNPEFLRESTAIDDFYHPPKTVIGGFDSASCRAVQHIYHNIPGELLTTSLEGAEFVKYVDNTWHALKVSFGNEIGRLCKAVGVDSHDVMDIFLKDTKLNISPYYLKPGFAFGGSCLPKDTRGIAHLARSLNVEVPVINHINQSNDKHIEHTVDMVDKLNVSSVGIVGVTFKSDTDDLRESPAVSLMKDLLAQGYCVSFYDPLVNANSMLDKDPEINATLLACRETTLDDVMEESQALLLNHDKPYTKKVIKAAHESVHIIDLVRVSTPMVPAENYQGVCW
jgi:GDP-mannose 6-dehydrogenase